MMESINQAREHNLVMNHIGALALLLFVKTGWFFIVMV